MLVLVVATEGEFGVVAQFLVEYAVEQAVAAINVALEAVVVFADGNDAATQAPWFVQRAGDVASGAHFVETVGNGVGADLGVVGRFLRTALMVPPGSLFAWVSPVAPRTTSMWS